MTKLIFLLLIFIVCGGVEIFFKFLWPVISLYDLQYVMLKFSIIVLAYFYIFIKRKKLSLNLLILFLFYSIFIFSVSLSEITFLGSFKVILVLELYLVLIVSLIIKEYANIYGFNIYKIIPAVISLISFLIIVKLYLIYDHEFFNMLSINGIKRLTHLEFVNSFAYVCAFSLVCTCLSWFYNKNHQKLNLKILLSYLILILFPVIYLLLAKSKGGMLVVLIGFSILIIKLKWVPFLLLLFGVIGVFLNSILSKYFFSIMMYGRTASSNQITEKVLGMFTNRFGASQFVDNPIAFLLNFPFGIGTTAASLLKYSVPDKDVIMTNHSLLFLLIDSYGLLTVFFIVLVLYLSASMGKKAFFLGIALLAIPVIFRNEPNLFFAIPMVIMMLGISLKNIAAPILVFPYKQKY